MRLPMLEIGACRAAYAALSPLAGAIVNVRPVIDHVFLEIRSPHDAWKVVSAGPLGRSRNPPAEAFGQPLFTYYYPLLRPALAVGRPGGHDTALERAVFSAACRL